VILRLADVERFALLLRDRVMHDLWSNVAFGNRICRIGSKERRHEDVNANR
jgi:hypothetical protein